MSREIKFRAYDKLKKKMQDVAGINWVEGIVMLWKQTGSVRSTYYVEIETVDLVQYTGLKDSKGVEIFEGDIVREKCLCWAGSEDFFWTGDVKYVLNPLGFIYEWVTRWGMSSRRLELRNTPEIEVIGNIHEPLDTK